jgi:hypothetical protein
MTNIFLRGRRRRRTRRRTRRKNVIIKIQSQGMDSLNNINIPSP